MVLSPVAHLILITIGNSTMLAQPRAALVRPFSLNGFGMPMTFVPDVNKLPSSIQCMFTGIEIEITT